MKLNLLLPTSLIFGLFTLSSCARNTPETYNAAQIGYAQEFTMGSVVTVKEILVNRNTLKNRTGTATGAVLGGVVGGVVGKEKDGSTGAAVGGVAGSIIGGLTGAAADKFYGKVPALELTVRDSSGKHFVVIQGRDQTFKAGERVKIITTAAGKTLISK